MYSSIATYIGVVFLTLVTLGLKAKARLFPLLIAAILTFKQKKLCLLISTKWAAMLTVLKDGDMITVKNWAHGIKFESYPLSIKTPTTMDL